MRLSRKFQLAIGMILGLNAACIGVSLVSFRGAQSEFQTLSQRGMPALENARRLAAGSRNVSALADKMAASANASDVVKLQQSLTEALKQPSEYAADVDARNGSSTLGLAVSNIASDFSAVQAAVRDRVLTAEKRQNAMQNLFAAYDKLDLALVPLVDEANFALVVNSERTIKKLDGKLKSQLQQDIRKIRDLMGLQAELTKVLDLIKAMPLSTEQFVREKFRRDIEKATARVGSSSAELRKQRAFPQHFDLVKSLESFASQAPVNGFTQGPDSQEAKRYASLASDLESSMTSAIGVALNDILVRTMAQNGQGLQEIPRLVYGLMVQLRQSHDAATLLHQIVADMVRGALASDAKSVDAMQERISNNIVDLSRLIIDLKAPYLATDFRTIKDLSFKSSGILALRMRELEAAKTAADRLSLADNKLDEIETSISGLAEQQLASVNTQAAAIGGRFSRLLTLLVALGGIAAAVAAGIYGVLLHKGVLRPLRVLATTTKRLSDGDYSVSIEGDGRPDEIGDMSRALLVFRETAGRMELMRRERDSANEKAAHERSVMVETLRTSIGAVVGAAARGDFSQRVKHAFNQPDLDALRDSVNQLTSTVDSGLDETTRVLAALARGDLGHRVTGAYQGAFGQLKNDVNVMADKITAIASRIDEATGTVDSATSNITLGIQDLSQRTEMQAASLEETSAAMEEISATVRQNADNAQKASANAVSARDAAIAGGDMTGEVVHAMQDIQKSSIKIGEIIGIIQDIAFQTNILALNAAVEAARAGDAGRGFSVVANEVRALSQRTSQASKDIQQLIHASAADVRKGVELSVNTTNRLQDILGRVRPVADSATEIAVASQEQSANIRQVASTIGSMEQITQRNVELVDQTTRSLAAARERIADLKKAISFFRPAEGQAESARAVA